MSSTREDIVKIIRGALTAAGGVTVVIPAAQIVRAFSPEARSATTDLLVVQLLDESAVPLTGGRGPRWLLFYIVPTCKSDLTAQQLGDAALAALDGATLPVLNRVTPRSCEFDNYRPGVEFDEGLKMYTDPIRFKMLVQIT